MQGFRVFDGVTAAPAKVSDRRPETNMLRPGSSACLAARQAVEPHPNDRRAQSRTRSTESRQYANSASRGFQPIGQVAGTQCPALARSVAAPFDLRGPSLRRWPGRPAIGNTGLRFSDRPLPLAASTPVSIDRTVRNAE